MSIELSLEDVKKVAFHYGFELEVILTFQIMFFPPRLDLLMNLLTNSTLQFSHCSNRQPLRQPIQRTLDL